MSGVYEYLISQFVYRKYRGVFFFAIVAVLCLTISASQQRANAAGGFVSHSGDQFTLDGAPFYAGGTNNYYLMYKSNLMVDDVLENASTMGLKVIRHWAAIDIGSLDGSVPHIDGGPKDGIYFQYWDSSNGKPAFNDGDTGLKKLDYIIKRAGELNLKVIPVMINNWSAFGGMDQYLNWYGLTNHDEFYTDSRVKQAYKNWLQHVINRVNTYTGIAYKDDPAIFAWELANEPRCVGSGAKPRSTNCTASILTSWVGEMSDYIKSLDANHMVSVGDEGFFTRPPNTDWAYNGNEGVDFDAYVKLPNIDFGTFHMYPEDWGKDIPWSTQWITDHVEAAHAASKPVLFEEFGLKDQSRRDYVYQLWTNTFCQSGGNAWAFWILTGVQDDGTLYPDYDRYRIVYPSDTAGLLSTKAHELESRQCGITPTLTPTLDVTNTPTPTRVPPQGALFEAEDGTLNGTNISKNRADYSGTGYVTGFDNDGDSVTVHVSVTTPGTYPLVIGYASEFSDKYQDIYVNGAFVGNILFALTPTFSETSVGNITLQPGDNTIEVRKSWGWVDIDYFLIVGASAPTPVPTNTPIQPTATATETQQPTVVIPTNTAIPPTVLPTNVPGKIRPRLELSALCSPQPNIYRIWRVQNKTNAPVTFNWVLLGTQQHGTGFVPAQQSVTFQTVTWQNRPNVVIVEANHELQDTAVSSVAKCKM